MRRSELVILIILLASFILAIYLYPQMPEKMASHWNYQGKVDGYLPKFWGLFLMPIISVGLFLLFIIIPKIDPLKANIEQFRKYYDRFVMLVVIFLFYLYLLTIFWNKGFRFSMISFLSPAFALLFYYAGVLTEKSKRNWFIGIRTPWTLTNDIVWDKTHRLGGKMFKICGIFALIGLIFPGYALFFVIVPITILMIFTLVYSYFEYKKEISK